MRAPLRMIHWLAVGADPKSPQNINHDQTFYWSFSNRIGLPNTRALRLHMTHVRLPILDWNCWKCWIIQYFIQFCSVRWYIFIRNRAAHIADVSKPLWSQPKMWIPDWGAPGQKHSLRFHRFWYWRDIIPGMRFRFCGGTIPQFKSIPSLKQMFANVLIVWRDRKQWCDCLLYGAPCHFLLISTPRCSMTSTC